MKKAILIIAVAISLYGCKNEAEHRANCTYTLPSNCVLMYSAQQGKYAIGILGYGETPNCLYTDDFTRRIDHFWITLQKPDLFADSCDAKGLCRRCVIQDRSTIPDLK